MIGFVSELRINRVSVHRDLRAPVGQGRGSRSWLVAALLRAAGEHLQVVTRDECGVCTSLAIGPKKLFGSTPCPHNFAPIKVVDLETKEALEPNGRGELLVRTRFLMLGYKNRPDVSLLVPYRTVRCYAFQHPGVRQSLMARRYCIVFLSTFFGSKLTDEATTADGWYKTGDYGYYDDKDRLHVVDRVKDLIRLPSGRLVRLVHDYIDEEEKVA